MSSEDVLYSTALIDGSGNTIDIDRVNDQKRADSDYIKKHSFSCPCCGLEMMAVLGSIRARHFRHFGTKCDPNYYLHSTAEQVFYEEYKKCLDEGKPFIITVFSEIRCVEDCSINNKQDCPKRFKKHTINLTEIYSKISPETKVKIDGRYRCPDLLLESDAGKQLWVEIWVSHRTEENKRKDGDILEIKIESKEDIQRIRSHNLAQKDRLDDSIRYYLKEECQFPEKGNSKPVLENMRPVFGPIVEDPDSDLRSGQYKDTSIPLISHSGPIDNLKISLDLTSLKVIYVAGVPEYHKPAKPEWIDLGLPSGTLWSKEYMGSMSLNKALECFPDMIPNPNQFEELVNSCNAIGIHPAGFIGPNGTRLEMYEGDFWTCSQLDNNQAIVFHREFLPSFAGPLSPFTKTIENSFAKADRNMVFCVRLTKRK